MSLLIAYFINTILKLFLTIYELHNVLCNVMISKKSLIFMLLIGLIIVWKPLKFKLEEYRADFFEG